MYLIFNVLKLLHEVVVEPFVVNHQNFSNPDRSVTLAFLMPVKRWISIAKAAAPHMRHWRGL